MSLIHGYSSDEDDTPVIAQDAFGISALPSSKKPRVKETEVETRVETSAPDVLAEVRNKLTACASFHAQLS